MFDRDRYLELSNFWGWEPRGTPFLPRPEPGRLADWTEELPGLERWLECNPWVWSATKRAALRLGWCKAGRTLGDLLNEGYPSLEMKAKAYDPAHEEGASFVTYMWSQGYFALLAAGTKYLRTEKRRKKVFTGLSDIHTNSPRDETWSCHKFRGTPLGKLLDNLPNEPWTQQLVAATCLAAQGHEVRRQNSPAWEGVYRAIVAGRVSNLAALARDLGCARQRIHEAYAGLKDIAHQVAVAWRVAEGGILSPTEAVAAARLGIKVPTEAERAARRAAAVCRGDHRAAVATFAETLLSAVNENPGTLPWPA